MALVRRRAHVAVSSVSHIDASVTNHQVLGFRASFGFDQQVSEASITVPTLAMPGGDVDAFIDDTVTVTGGAGANIGATRFSGRVRDIDRDLWPRAVTLLCKGPLHRAAEYENGDDPGALGGLRLADILGGALQGTDQAIVLAVLNRASVPGVVSGNILGTGRLMGRSNPDVWMWRAGTPTDPNRPFDVLAEAGQTALDYINNVDSISAFADYVTNPLAPTGGFYRTYDSLTGVPRRQLMGGRPRGANDFTFTEGVDIFRASSRRSYPQANYVIAKGYDAAGAFGTPLGPMAFAVQSSNPYQPGTEKHTKSVSSNLIEWDTETRATNYGTLLGLGQPVGMTCARVAEAAMLDVNRITVTVTLTTPLDYIIWPGQTHLVRGPGGAPDRLGVGEPLWVQHLDIECVPSGGVLVWSQTMKYIGGGAPDVLLPLPPA